MKTFCKNVSQNNVYNEYVKIINGILNLSNRELDVFAILLMLNNEKSSSDIVCNKNRKYIMREVGVNKSNLSKYISNLKDLGILKYDEKGNCLIHEYFIPILNNNKLEISFLLNISNL